MKEVKIIKIFELPKIALEEVETVYVGKPNMCRCGCSGTYAVPTVNEEIADKNRGYACPNDVNDKKVKRVINKMTKNASAGIEVQDDYIYTLVVGQTEYSIYLLKGVKK